MHTDFDPTVLSCVLHLSPANEHGDEQNEDWRTSGEKSENSDDVVFGPNHLRFQDVQ